MSVARLKTWVIETLTASDLNAEFDNLINNQQSLGTPRTAAWDMDGYELILDADADTSITVDSDDRIDVKIGGTDSILLGLDATNTSGVYTFDGRAVTATAATNVARLHLKASNALTIPAGTTPIAAGLWIAEPNLTATGTITKAATVYIADAPTEGGTNYALWVDAGNVQFDGNLTVGVETDGVHSIVLGTKQATTSGTTIDFTSIPSWVKRITINLNAVSHNGSSLLAVQLGDSDGVETSGYTSVLYNFCNASSELASNSSMFVIGGYGSMSTNYTFSGSVVLSLEDSSDYTWCLTSNIAQTGAILNAAMNVAGGIKALSAALDRIRLTSVSADTFDAGEVNITYE